jgi:O-antigen biosynthesis protein
MPTGGRAEFALQAVRYFQRQDYPALELVVVDDGDDGLAARLPDDDRIRYLRAPARETIGAKRNRAAAVARGAIHALWDDDDWFGPRRISIQVEPLLAGADVSGLVTPAFLDLARWEFWRASPALHRRLFAGDVANGTLAYHRRVWHGLARFPSRSLAEDAAFLRAALRRGAELVRVDGDGHFAYVRHGRNSWAFPLGRHVDPRGWARIPEPLWLAGDAAFYAERRRVPAPTSGPVVSCVMPTRERPRLAARAARYFLRQDYARAELIVLDDGAVPAGALLPRDPRIRHVRLDGRRTIGAKRNLGCELARGELVANWDDDDWSAPWRLSYQVAELERGGADVAGLARLLFYEPGRGRAWRYEWPASARAWASDGTLLYTKELWRRNPFPDSSMGIDCRFLWNARPKRVHAHGDERFYVGMIHRGNTSPKNTRHRLWRAHDAAAVEALLAEDAAFYAAAWPGTDAATRAS